MVVFLFASYGLKAQDVCTAANINTTVDANCQITMDLTLYVDLSASATPDSICITDSSDNVLATIAWTSVDDSPIAVTLNEDGAGQTAYGTITACNTYKYVVHTPTTSGACWGWLRIDGSEITLTDYTASFNDYWVGDYCRDEGSYDATGMWMKVPNDASADSMRTNADIEALLPDCAGYEVSEYGFSVLSH